MLDFLKENDQLLLSYTSELRDQNWIYAELAKGEYVTLRKTFTLSSNELISGKDPKNEHAPAKFVIGEKRGEYYHLSNDVLEIENDFFIHESIPLTTKLFIAERNISIFSKLDQLVSEEIRIGGSAETAIPESTFNKLLQKFPNSYELTKYAHARISAVISSYIDIKEDYEEKYQQYMNRKIDIVEPKTYQMVANAEIEKYNFLLSKLTKMLRDEENYSERQWQEEILQIILLLYPKSLMTLYNIFLP